LGGVVLRSRSRVCLFSSGVIRESTNTRCSDGRFQARIPGRVYSSACRLVMVIIPWVTIARCTKLLTFPWFKGTIYSPWLRRGMRPAWYETIFFALFLFPVLFILRDSFLIPNETRSEDTRYDTMSSLKNYWFWDVVLEVLLRPYYFPPY